MEIKINQLTPRNRSGQVEDIKAHFTYVMRFGDEEISGSGALSSEEYMQFIDFDGLTKAIRKKMSDNIANGDVDHEEDAE